MLRNKEYNKYIKFEKTIEDLFYDANSGLFSEMSARDENDQFFIHGNVPQFIVDGMFDPDLLDVSLIGKYSERWLNKTAGNSYSVDSDGELVNPDDLSMLAQQILDYYYKKWDNLLYLYYEIVMGTDYNPIENYSSLETTDYDDLTDTLTKDGSEKQSQNAVVQTKPLKTVDRITDEYGALDSGVYKNGIKDTTEYNRNYTQTEVAGTGGQSPKPFVSVDEKGLAGMNSTGTFGTKGAGDVPASGGDSRYNPDTMNIHSELGEHSTTFTDNKDNNSKLPYESTERTGKHTSLHETGGEISGTAVVQGNAQETTILDADDNYTQLTFEDRTDTNVRSGSVTVTKAGNIGVMTASQMLKSAWEGEMERNFLDAVFKDVADYISLNCY